ncbi:hypothetical protein Bca52824_083878 [Brassica carinata]|uniref:RING-type E3 ubiquitin transferase n=1 Tax=Brassica carinata TaxID=52824 RepID=A0A8X7TTG7_BRACI|nr:hypothetical protein Bca52824_083878 [Brassica carinata]
MARETNAAERVLAGEGSSSRPKRPRLSSPAEDGENVGEVTATVAGDEVRSGTLVDLDLLDCSVCCHPLSNPIFQVFVSSYGKKLAHEKECRFGLCYCPAPDCNYSGLCKDLYRHYHAYHLDTWKGFTCGVNKDAWLEISEKILVLQERRDGALVAVQCFEEEQGVYVTVNCIAPCAPGVSEFSFQLTYSNGAKSMSFEFDEMNQIQKVSFQTPEKGFISVPRYFLDGRTTLKMKICINRLGEEEDSD